MRFPHMLNQPVRLFLSGAVAIFIVVGAGWWLSSTITPAPVERTPSGGGPPSYAAALLNLDRNVEGVGLLVRANPGEWLVEERLANQLMARGRLTGSFADYAAAQAALDRAFAEAPRGTGPHQTQMALAFTLHRLALAGAVTMPERWLDTRPRVPAPTTPAICCASPTLWREPARPMRRWT